MPCRSTLGTDIVGIAIVKSSDGTGTIIGRIGISSITIIERVSLVVAPPIPETVRTSVPVEVGDTVTSPLGATVPTPDNVAASASVDVQRTTTPSPLSNNSLSAVRLVISGAATGSGSGIAGGSSTGIEAAAFACLRRPRNPSVRRASVGFLGSERPQLNEDPKPDEVGADGASSPRRSVRQVVHGDPIGVWDRHV